MIRLKGNEYQLLLLDTNALSDILKEPKKWISFLNDNFDISKTILSYSIFSLSEIYKSKPLFSEYLTFFSVYPSVILDGYDSIFKKEIASYRKQNKEINPIVIAPFVIRSNEIDSPREKLEQVLKLSGFYDRTQYWQDARKEILDGIIELKKNFTPANGKTYSLKEVENFIFIVSSQQIRIRDENFARNEIQIMKRDIDIHQFPSIFSTSFVVFYKFYPDNRDPILSDVFDIIISSLLPYVDIVITEGHLCEIIRKVQKRHHFINNLKYYSIREIKQKIL